MKTLFELSHALRPEITLDQSILVIIDAQQEYETGKLPIVGFNQAVESIERLLKQARKLDIPIVHVLHEGSSGGLFDPQTFAFKSIDGLWPLPDETVVLKRLPDAFAGTTLNHAIEKFGNHRTLLLCGFMTHMCITATASSALDLGLQSAVVKDAVATRDLRGPDGEVISARLVNQVSLAALQDRLSWLIDSRELLGTSEVVELSNPEVRAESWSHRR